MGLGRVCVIGAGVSGVTTAVLLASHGYPVTLVEKRRKLMPLIRGFDFDGVRVEAGLHYVGGFGPGGPLTRMMTHLGVMDKITPVPLDPQAFDRVYQGGREFFAFPNGWDNLKSALKEKFPQEAVPIDKYLDAVRDCYYSFPYMNPKAPVEAGVFGLGPFGDVSLTQFMDGLGLSRDLKHLFSIHTLLFGAGPDHIPFAANAVAVGAYYESAWTISGGGASVAEAFGARLADLGVEFITGMEASSIAFDGAGCVCGVKFTQGETIDAKTVVFTANPKLLMNMTPDGVFRPAYKKRVLGLCESETGVMAFARSDFVREELKSSNIFIFDESQNHFGVLYLTALKSKLDASSAGGFLAIAPCDFGAYSPWAGSQKGRRGQEYNERKAAELDLLMGRVAGFCEKMAQGAGKIGGATPLTFSHYTDSGVGALYGVTRRVGQVNPFAPTRVPGLLLSGQAIALPGLLGAMSAGYITAGHIVGEGKLLKELSELG